MKHKRFFAAATDESGSFVAISGLSEATARRGQTRTSIIGSKLWDFSDRKSAETIRQRVAACLLDGTDQHYVVESQDNEHWNCQLFRAKGAAMVAFAEQVFPDGVHLSPEERMIISLMTDDQPTEFIADAIHVSAGAFAHKLKRLRDKCGCVTNHGLVAWAIRRGMV